MTMERILASIEMQRPAVAKPGDGATPCPRCGANAVAHRFRARDGAMVETLHCGRCGDVCGSRDPVGARCADCRQGRSATPGDRVAWHRCGRGLPGWWGSAVHRCGQFDPMAENRPETALAGDDEATRHPTLPSKQNRLEAILGRFRAIMEGGMSESERERWLSGLKPGDKATVVCACGRYPVTVAAVEGETIALEASGLRPGMLWVWRQTGMRPDWRCYIRPTDAPADYPSPLDALESMMEAA